MSKTAMQQLSELSLQLPLNVLKDIDHRVSDWLAEGGDENDPYIWQQVRYVKNYIATQSAGPALKKLGKRLNTRRINREG